MSAPALDGSDTPRTDALVSKWDDDGAARGSAYIELRDLCRELEATRPLPNKRYVSLKIRNSNNFYGIEIEVCGEAVVLDPNCSMEFCLEERK